MQTNSPPVGNAPLLVLSLSCLVGFFLILLSIFAIYAVEKLG